MNKFKDILNFIKNNLNGEKTKIALLVIFIFIMFKLLGIVGLFLCLILAIGADVCNTTDFTAIYIFFKNKFFLCTIMVIMLVSCGSSNKVTSDANYGISYMKLISKDTIANDKIKHMVIEKQMPPLSKFSKSYLKNTEENKYNVYYVYYDSIHYTLYNMKELVNQQDTLYIMEKKIMK